MSLCIPNPSCFSTSGHIGKLGNRVAEHHQEHNFKSESCLQGAAGAMCVNTPKALRAGATPQLGTHRRQKPHAVAQDSQEVCPDELADQLKHVQILSDVSGVVVGVP